MRVFRKIHLLIALLLLTVSVQANEIKAGEGVSGIGRIGEEMSAVLQRLGQPDDTVEQHGREFHVYGDQFVVIGKETVFMIQVFAPRFKTTSGIAVGATRDQVLAKEGKDYKLYQNEEEATYQFIYPRGISFMFDQSDRVIAINAIGTVRM